MWRIAIVVSLLAAACDGSNIGPAAGGDGGTGGAGGIAGSGGGSPCGPSQRLDGRGNCLDICLNQSQCSADHICHLATNLCLPVAQDPCDPLTCQTGWVCPGDGTGSCEPGPGYCQLDEDCIITERCDAGRCISRAGDIVKVCAIDGDCPPFMSCQLGVCFGCVDDIQCIGVSPEATCVLGTCVVQDLGPAAQCLTANCGPGTRCNPATGQCEPVCTDSSDCPIPGEICAPLINRCVVDPGCVDDTDCPGAQTCQSGFGRSVCTGCSDSDPCRTGLRCIIGVCLPDLGSSPCDNVTCQPSDSCDPLDGSCYATNGTCNLDEDCRPGHTCNFLHFCSGCTIDADCRPNQRCFIGACAPF